METAVAAPARLAVEATPFALRDVEDLHQADLDAVLGDRLLDAGLAAASARALADLVREHGMALSAHALGSRAGALAVS